MSRRLHALYCATERAKRWFAGRFTPLGKVFVLICCLAAVFGINVQQTMIFQIFAIAAVLLGVSFVLSLRFRVPVRMHRHLPGTCVAGSTLYYRVECCNDSEKTIRGLSYAESVPMTLPSHQTFVAARAEDGRGRNFFDRRMGYHSWLRLLQKTEPVQTPECVLPDIGSGKSQTVEVRLRPRQRGSIHFDGYRVIRRDPLGLCKRQIHQADGANLLVLPRLYQVPNIVLHGGRKYHRGGISGARNQGDSTEFLSLREYVHGDPIKHIDWKSTARTDRAIVKQYRDEYFCRYALVLDSFTTAHYSTAFEEAVSVSASILLAQDSVDAILDLLFVGDTCITCSAGSGVGGYRRMLEMLASVTTCRERSFAELAGLVKSHAALLSGVVLVLIDLDDGRLALINFLAARNIPVKIVVLVERREDVQSKVKALAPESSFTIIEIDHVEEQLARL
ncbi:MAG: DUF58 domain-containing protein [Desulfopila sp.]